MPPSFGASPPESKITRLHATRPGTCANSVDQDTASVLLPVRPTNASVIQSPAFAYSQHGRHLHRFGDSWLILDLLPDNRHACAQSSAMLLRLPFRSMQKVSITGANGTASTMQGMLAC